MKNNEQIFKFVSFAILVAAFFIGFFNRFAPATFASSIGESLGLSAVSLGTLAATHFWVYTVMQVPAGLIVDRFGIRLPAMLGTLLSGFGAVAMAMADSYIILLSGPFLVGLGMSLVFVALMKSNAVWFDSSKFGMITGVSLLIGTLGSIVSQAPAHFLLELTDWRTIFAFLGAITILTAFLIYFFWRAPTDSIEPSNYELASKSISKTKNIPKKITWLDILASRQLWLILLAISGTNGTFYAFASMWGTQLLIDGYSVNADLASLILTISLLIYAVASPVFGQISDWLKTRKNFIWIASLLNVVAWFWFLLIPDIGFISGLVCFLLLGLSSGAQVTVSFAAVKESVHANITGTAIAFVNMGVFFVTAVIQSAYGWMVSVNGTDQITGSIYVYALWLPASLSMLGFIASLWVKETYFFESN